MSVLLTSGISAFCGDYDIPLITTGGRSFPQQVDEVIALSPGDIILKEVSSLSTFAPGELVMRRRFSENEYRLYKGIFANNAFSSEKNLFSFVLPAGMTVAELSRLKFYSTRTSNPNNDLPTVYFDNTHAYISIIPKLYYFTDTWHELVANNIKVDADKSQPIGDIAVTSTPTGARITVDGEDKNMLTPSYVTDVFAGQHRVEVRLPNYQPSEKIVEVKAGEVSNISFNLLSALGCVEITSTPAGAKVTFNNVESGVTPLTLKDLKPGIYTVDLGLDLYKSQSKQFSISMNKKGKLDVTLEPNFGTLRLPQLPTATQFAVDNKLVSSQTVKLNPGKHRIIWNGGEDYSTIDTIVTITVNADISFTSTPIRFVGGIKILPVPMDAEVFVNGESKGLGAKRVNELPTGTYTVSGKKSGYQLTMVEVRVKNNTVETVKLNLAQIPNINGGDVVKERDKPKAEAGGQLHEGDKQPTTTESMVKIKGGSFIMGSNEDKDRDNYPAHKVVVSDYLIDKTEVTQKDFEYVMKRNPSYFKNNPTFPVENVSWFDAHSYCRKLGKRLPTEAEWEYAARAGSTTKYYWGDLIDKDYVWFDNDSTESRTYPVGVKKPNTWGLYDMSGNVSEWCNDYYESGYYKISTSENPVGPATGNNRVTRGGSWSTSTESDENCSGTRTDERPYHSNNNIGFRCVKSISAIQTNQLNIDSNENSVTEIVEVPQSKQTSENSIKILNGIFIDRWIDSIDFKKCDLHNFSISCFSEKMPKNMAFSKRNDIHGTYYKIEFSYMVLNASFGTVALSIIVNKIGIDNKILISQEFNKQASFARKKCERMQKLIDVLAEDVVNWISTNANMPSEN